MQDYGNNGKIFYLMSLSERPNRGKIDEVMRTNVTSPIIVTHYFLPLLRQSLHSSQHKFSPSTGCIVNIGSDYGSLTKCSVYGSSEKGHLPHKVSKAGLSQFSRVLSEDLKAEGLLVVNLHPGWVATDMGTHEADISVDESVKALVNTIERLNETHHGGFFDRNGDPLPL